MTLTVDPQSQSQADYFITFFISTETDPVDSAKAARGLDLGL